MNARPPGRPASAPGARRRRARTAADAIGVVAAAGDGRQQALEQALEGGAVALAAASSGRAPPARGEQAARPRSPAAAQVQADRASVGRIALACDQSLGLQALDDPHPARTAEPEHAAQRVDRRAVGEGRAWSGRRRSQSMPRLAHAVAKTSARAPSRLAARAPTRAPADVVEGAAASAPSVIVSRVATPGAGAPGPRRPWTRWAAIARR